MKLAVIGLGPAGLALAHRAVARGMEVTAWEPHPVPTHFLSVFADELPRWAVDLPSRSISAPVVYTHDGTRVPLHREYRVLDNERVWKKLTTFPVIKESVNADAVTAVELEADIVVDARGTRDSYAPGMPVQVARDRYTTVPSETVFMDFRSPDPDRFTYTIPLDDGRFLQQDTILATVTPEQGTDVFIPLVPVPYSGPHVPYGTRAGFIHPFTGYSVATSFRLADKTLDALQARVHNLSHAHSTHKPFLSSPALLPWQTPAFRADLALSRRCLTTLLKLPADFRRDIVEAVFALSPETARKFLILGNLGATLKGMARIWIGLRDGSHKARLISAFATSTATGQPARG
ncbi:MAG: lycopene cyclase family protein [Corynebacterium glucuronolyticum]|nr:lycopene cyclase family protein [Mycobacteriaceae bacterium]MDY5834899.1 lycopene cyclase family protein [Corynebacterium glucuronolyticum]